MITYDFEKANGPIYLYLYNCLKEDIMAGRLAPGEKLPSKRSFANNNGISTITIQNAYDQLVSEGYVYTLPKRGYYVAKLDHYGNKLPNTDISYDIKVQKESREALYDFSNNGVDPEHFPFSVWTRISREVMSHKKEDLMAISPSGGARELREAIAGHLRSFRGMLVDPDQIVVGAGTEYLYGLIVQLLGKKKGYVIENPGYKKLEKIYRQWGIDVSYAAMDDKGLALEDLRGSRAQVAHICPNHHFPTGITMPASRRYEILAWANEQRDRYIIEDDYDSEFRMGGKPIPTLFSIDGCEKVIYINTFSKSLTPTIRISYMVLPVHLANLFYEKMSFSACTVSNFEQYTLAKFIREGYFEKHINRMRLYYKRLRKNVMETMKKSRIGDYCSIIESDSGLHFLLKVNEDLSAIKMKERLRESGILVNTMEDYYFERAEEESNLFIVNYSNLTTDKLLAALGIIEGLMGVEPES